MKQGGGIMATSKEYSAFILDQMRLLDGMRKKK